MEKTKEMVMFNSDEAAQYKTGISGWVSRNGMFYGENERAARYDGCTHTICEDCGKPVERGYLICRDCREKRDIKEYNAMPKVVWNDFGGLYSDPYEKFFWGWDEVEDFCEDEGIKEEDLRLVICEPQYPRQLEEDYFCDELPEDGELPDEIVKAMETFNKVLKESVPLSWYPGKKAAIRK